MRTRALAMYCASLLVFGCSNDAPLSAVVSGVILDSIANLPVDGQFVYITVGTTTDSTKTSATGQFTFTVPTGDVRLTYPDPARYELYDRTIAVRRDTLIVLKLRRTLPFLRSFSVTAGVLHATIVDLQGGNTIAQDNSTWVVYDYGLATQSSAISADQWTWTAVDALTWSVSVDTHNSTLTDAYWNVMDNSYPASFLCVPGQPDCTPNAP